jgi:hypothetical protein
MGDRAQIYRGFYAAGAIGADARQHGGQRRPARARAEDASDWNRYAVWTGIGAVGTALLGIALFGEPATAARLACIGLIVAGIVGLKLVT